MDSEILQRYEESLTAYNRASSLMARGRYEEATPILKQALARYPRQLLIDGEPDADPSIIGSFETLFAGIKAMLAQLNEKLQLEESARPIPEPTPPPPQRREPEPEPVREPEPPRMQMPQESYSSLQDIVERNMRMRSPELREESWAPSAVEESPEVQTEIPTAEEPVASEPIESIEPLDEIDSAPAAEEFASVEASPPALEDIASVEEPAAAEAFTIADESAPAAMEEFVIPEEPLVTEKQPAVEETPLPVYPEGEAPEALIEGVEEELAAIEGETRAAAVPPDVVEQTYEGGTPWSVKEPLPERRSTPRPSAPKEEEILPEEEMQALVKEEILDQPVEEFASADPDEAPPAEEDKMKKAAKGSGKEVGVKLKYIFSRFRKQKKTEEPLPELPEEQATAEPAPVEIGVEEILPQEEFVQPAAAEEILTPEDPAPEKAEPAAKAPKRPKRKTTKKKKSGAVGTLVGLVSLVVIGYGIYLAVEKSLPVYNGNKAYDAFKVAGKEVVPAAYIEMAKKTAVELGGTEDARKIVADAAAAHAETKRLDKQPDWGIEALEALANTAGITSPALRSELLEDYVALVEKRVVECVPAAGAEAIRKAQLQIAANPEGTALAKKQLCPLAYSVLSSSLLKSLEQRNVESVLDGVRAADSWAAGMNPAQRARYTALRSDTVNWLIASAKALAAHKQVPAAVNVLNNVIAISPASADAKKLLLTLQAAPK